MSALSTLRAVDGVTASLCAELHALSVQNARFGRVVLMRDVPIQYRLALARQGVRELVTINGEPALRMEHVEAWLNDVRRAFHQADSCESIPGLTWLRRFSFAGIADGNLGAREVDFAQKTSQQRGMGPVATLVAQRLGLPLRQEPAQAPIPLMTAKALPGALVDKVLADDRIETHEVWQLVDRARRDGDATSALEIFRSQYGASFTEVARTALDDYLKHGPIDMSRPEPGSALRSLWRDTRRDWDLDVLRKPVRECTPAEMLALAKPIFSATNDDGYRLANEVKAFFERYPSTGGRNLSCFFAGWAINETFGSLPMQAYNYTQTHPVDANGKPRGPLWRSYVQAVCTAAPRDVIEEAFLRAHIADFKGSTLSPKFRQLYEISPASYRKVIDAYVHTLRACEAELDLGTRPLDIVKHYPLAVTRDLVRRGTIGMVWNDASFRNGLNPRNPLTQEWWFGFWRMLGTFVTNRHSADAKANAIAVDLTAGERLELSDALGIAIGPQTTTLDSRQLAQATFAEPLRGNAHGKELPRYPLALADFQRVDPIHGTTTYAGVDGVFQVKELLGVVRQAQARVRSNLIEEFATKYPTPMNGLLTYSANMLALTGSYHQHEAYGMVPNFIMPVDNFGNPKSREWQAYVDAYESFKANGAPSKEELERLWFEAHMVDFEQVDSPEFRAQAESFWREAIRDPKLAPLATYFIAMVHGREVFEEAQAERLPYEEALVRSFDHFRGTFVAAGGIPFLGEEASSIAKLFGESLCPSPDFDERGLPTDRLLTKRMIEGLTSAAGITGTLLRGGVLKPRDANGKHIAINTVSDRMVDLKTVMSPDDYAKVDPSVRAFYSNPTAYRGEAVVGINAANDSPTTFGSLMAHVLTTAVIHGLNHVGAAVIGTRQVTPGKFALEDDLRKDAAGATHWNRYVVGKDGHRKALFMASFESTDGKIKETFSAAGVAKVPLYFDVEAHEGGIRLVLDQERSSRLFSTFASVDFITKPAPGGGINVRGELVYKGLGSANSTFTARLYPTGQGAS